MSYYQFNQKEKENYSKEKAYEYYLKKQRSSKRKVKVSIQKLVKRRKRQDYKVSKRKISAVNPVQKGSITKPVNIVLPIVKLIEKILIVVNKKEFINLSNQLI